ncbi:sensor histidine kinase [Tenacibaculum singaporense]|uniref:sensor histidine kinase n=1 Tax=Tenacibaculum singaporense TaxID=2358479 RepID=UPI000F66B3DC|nr:sensor histidine kinase [Tenacibaculum singaporense]RSC92131.1 histidine kinase [Tenacibaculum singaporense]
MKFLLKKRKHQYYLLVGVLLMVLFFIGYRLITNKITSEAEGLIEVVIKQYAKEKESILQFDFNDFNKFIVDTQKIIESSADLDRSELKNRLLFNSELAFSEENIDVSFVYFFKDNEVFDSYFFGSIDTSKNVLERVKSLEDKSQVFDTVLNLEGKTYYRKIIKHQLQDGTFVVFGYDINLLKYWNYFSQKYSGKGGYVTLTNNKGVCMLHPEIGYIGKHETSFFNKVSLNQVLKNYEQQDYKKKKQVKVAVISEYLNLEVMRYYDVIQVGNSELILITSFPLNIFIKESINNIKQYLLWMSLLALLTFMLILGFSRSQLRSQHLRTLQYEQERKRLAISNEQYQQKNARLQLSQLRKKLNPHFLFNTLNSLHVLIGLDKTMSQQFVLKLSEVYRYLLKDKEANFTTVKEELHFLEQYFFLQKIRFNNSINLSITDKSEGEALLKKIPFLALETLTENAIKHNEITKKNPLFINVLIEKDKIVVSNNYNPRKSKKEKSYGVGLSYLSNFYAFYNVTSFKTEVLDKDFKCYLPLLSK